MQERLLEQGWEILTSGSAFGDLIGPTWHRTVAGLTTFGFVVEPKHLNRLDGLNGAMATAFLDIQLSRSVAEQTGERGIATVHLGVDFVDVARLGEFLETRAEITRAGRSVVFARGALTSGSRVIASAQGVWKIIGRKVPGG